MKQNIIETFMGAFVIAVALMFIYISYSGGHISTRGGAYTIYAKFNEVGGVSTGSDVRIGGIKIGTVNRQSLDPDNYRAVLKLTIQNDVQLPTDSSAAIVSDGLIGNKYVSITPGADENMLTANGEITFTQDSISLESLIGKFAFGSLKDGNKDEHAKKSENHNDTSSPDAETP